MKQNLALLQDLLKYRVYHMEPMFGKNARDLINGTTEFEKISFDDIIACRDDIMVQLTDMGLEPLKAFDIMNLLEKVDQVKI